MAGIKQRAEEQLRITEEALKNRKEEFKKMLNNPIYSTEPDFHRIKAWLVRLADEADVIKLMQAEVGFLKGLLEP